MSEDKELSGFDQFLLFIAGLVGTGGLIAFAWVLHAYWRPVAQWGVLGWLYLCLGGTVAFVVAFLVGLVPLLMISGLQSVLSGAREAEKAAAAQEEKAWKLCPKVERLMDCLDSEQVTDLIDCDDELWAALAEADEESLLHFKTEFFDWLDEALKLSSPYELVLSKVTEKCAESLPGKLRHELLGQLLSPPRQPYDAERLESLVDAWTEPEVSLDLLCLYIKGAWEQEFPVAGALLESVCERIIEHEVYDMAEEGEPTGAEYFAGLWDCCPDSEQRELVHQLAYALAYIKESETRSLRRDETDLLELFGKLPEAARHMFVEPDEQMMKSNFQKERMIFLGQALGEDERLKQWQHIVNGLAEGLAPELRKIVTDKWGEAEPSTHIGTFIEYDVLPTGGDGASGTVADVATLLAQLRMWVPAKQYRASDSGKAIELRWDGVIGCAHEVKLLVKRQDEGFGLALSSDCR